MDYYKLIIKLMCCIMCMVAGSIPGPILFGKVIDLTCWLWQDSCDGQGACLYYDNRRMSYNLLAIGLAYNFVSCVCFLLAMVFYKTAILKNSVSMNLSEPNGPASCHTSCTTLTQPATPHATHVNGEVSKSPLPPSPHPPRAESNVDAREGKEGSVRDSKKDDDS
jgi:hypothetical protein